jgi:hypothetical protein
MSTPTIPAGNLFMNATLYTGNGSTQTITNGGTGTSFQPDFVWVKDRTSAYNNILANSVAGATNFLSSNTASAESSTAGVITSLNSNGFSVGSVANVNQNTDALVAWQWLAGGTAVSNTSGSITSQVSANTTSGFSVVTFTVPTSGTATIGHGLGVAPAMIITKNRNGTIGWNTYHQSLGNTQYVLLNSTAASATLSTLWNSTSPTSSVFSMGSAFANTGTYVAYCWSEVAGYSKFGSYTGNGSADGPFVYTGFRPKFVLIKISSGTADDWYLYDTSRNTYNVSNLVLFPDLSNAEATASTTTVDILSNGFKCRGAGNGINASGSTYIYAAFAENPFKYANAR